MQDNLLLGQSRMKLSDASEGRKISGSLRELHLTWEIKSDAGAWFQIFGRTNVGSATTTLGLIVSWRFTWCDIKVSGKRSHLLHPLYHLNAASVLLVTRGPCKWIRVLERPNCSYIWCQNSFLILCLTTQLKFSKPHLESIVMYRVAQNTPHKFEDKYKRWHTVIHTPYFTCRPNPSMHTP